jgi:hypothetical protein
MLEVKEPPPENTYFADDTHWNTKGATIAVGAPLERLDVAPRLRPEEVINERTTSVGDLSNLLGAPKEMESPKWTVKRPVAEVKVIEEVLPEGGKQSVASRPGGGAPLIPGRTVFVYDSFGVAMIDALGTYTRELAALQWFSTPAGDLVEAIMRGDTIVLEKVERDFNFLASDGGYVTPAFLDALEQRIKAERRGSR